MSHLHNFIVNYYILAFIVNIYLLLLLRIQFLVIFTNIITCIFSTQHPNTIKSENKVVLVACGCYPFYEQDSFFFKKRYIVAVYRGKYVLSVLPLPMHKVFVLLLRLLSKWWCRANKLERLVYKIRIGYYTQYRVCKRIYMFAFHVKIGKLWIIIQCLKPNCILYKYI